MPCWSKNRYDMRLVIVSFNGSIHHDTSSA